MLELLHADVHLNTPHQQVSAVAVPLMGGGVLCSSVCWIVLLSLPTLITLFRCLPHVPILSSNLSCLQNRCVKIFTGHQHSVEKNLLKCEWSPDGSRVTAGSADRMVYVWDTTTRRILYKVGDLIPALHLGSYTSLKPYVRRGICTCCCSYIMLHGVFVAVVCLTCSFRGITGQSTRWCFTPSNRSLHQRLQTRAYTWEKSIPTLGDMYMF